MAKEYARNVFCEIYIQGTQAVHNWVGCLPGKLIWRVKILYKVASFTWLVAKEVVLRQDNLKRRRDYQLRPRCYLCEEQAETTISFYIVNGQIILWKIFINLRGIGGYARKHKGCTKQLEQRWQLNQSEGKMEDCPSMYLLDCLPREKSLKFCGQEMIPSEIKDELLCPLLFLV